MLSKGLVPSCERMVEPSSKSSMAVRATIFTPPDSDTVLALNLRLVCQLPVVSAAKHSANYSPENATTHDWPRHLPQRRDECHSYSISGRSTSEKVKDEIINQFPAPRGLHRAVA